MTKLGWETLFDDKLTGTGTEIDSGTITAKKFLYVSILVVKVGSSENSPSFRFNGDDGTNYPIRRANNGAADDTFTTTYDFLYNGYGGTNTNRQQEMYIINEADKMKLCILNGSQGMGSGSGTAPDTNYMWGKWTNTSDQITQIVFHGQDFSLANRLGADTQMIILGTD